MTLVRNPSRAYKVGYNSINGFYYKARNIMVNYPSNPISNPSNGESNFTVHQGL